MHHIVVHMAQNTAAEGRTDTKRFDEDVSGDELIEGDRIDKRLVARTMGQLGQQIKPSHPEGEPEPKTQLVAITEINRMDDVHSALLADTETGTIIRASRHDSSSAWSQKEADWKVHDIGTEAVVEEVHELQLGDSDEPVDDEKKYVSGWIDIVIGDAAVGYDDYEDERKLDGRTLIISDFDGRKAIATISLDN